MEDYPDWESAEALYFITVLGDDRYGVKVAGLTHDPIRSLSGVAILPDYDLEEVVGRFAGLILVGGIGWTNHVEAHMTAIRPVVEDAAARGCPIGGVGTGADILGSFGLLNHLVHTGNSTQEMSLVSDLGHTASQYTGADLFKEAGSIRNGKIVTAKNISSLAFARAYMWELDVDQKKADRLYEEHKDGAAMPILDVEAVNQPA